MSRTWTVDLLTRRVTLRECLGRGATEKEAMARVAERARKLLADRKAREAPMFDEARVIFVEIAVGDEE